MRKDLQQPTPRSRSHTVESRMAIQQHPIHPMLVVYPIAFLSVVVVADGLFLLLEQPFWALERWGPGSRPISRTRGYRPFCST